jgi:hypothetical protein
LIDSFDSTRFIRSPEYKHATMATTSVATSSTSSNGGAAAVTTLFKIVKPKITKDPRFRGGCKLIQSGRDGAIDMFALLLEEARTTYGEASIETAPAYFEYGRALFRESQRQQQQQQQEQEQGEQQGEEADEVAVDHNVNDDDKDEQEKIAVKSETGIRDGEEDQKVEEDSVVSRLKDEDTSAVKGEEEHPVKKENEEEDIVTEKPTSPASAEEDDNGIEEDDEDEEEEDDAHLALTMMETAYAILDTFVQTCSAAQQQQQPSSEETNHHGIYLDWAHREELPRVLSNLGDVLSFLEHHADAADAYTRELALREETLTMYDETISNDDGKTNNLSLSLELLKERRKAVEACVLVATEILACPSDQDVVTTETNALLVKASERVSFAQGYYHQARDQLQETVLRMGELAGRCERDDDAQTKAEFNKEKENICFASTLVMGVGEQLYQNAEEEKHNQEAKEPLQKKSKR